MRTCIELFRHPKNTFGGTTVVIARSDKLSINRGTLVDHDQNRMRVISCDSLHFHELLDVKFYFTNQPLMSSENELFMFSQLDQMTVDGKFPLTKDFRLVPEIEQKIIQALDLFVSATNQYGKLFQAIAERSYQMGRSSAQAEIRQALGIKSDYEGRSIPVEY